MSNISPAVFPSASALLDLLLLFKRQFFHSLLESPSFAGQLTFLACCHHHHGQVNKDVDAYDGDEAPPNLIS